eukprot:4277304-Karenia_brevis.AAC.1
MQQLYKNNVHWIRFGTTSQRGFTVHTGVKQGCPLSGMLFVIVCDSFLRALRRAIGPRGALKAYADDIGIVLYNLWTGAPAVAGLFLDMSQIAG